MVRARSTGFGSVGVGMRKGAGGMEKQTSTRRKRSRQMFLPKGFRRPKVSACCRSNQHKHASRSGVIFLLICFLPCLLGSPWYSVQGGQRPVGGPLARACGGSRDMSPGMGRYCIRRPTGAEYYYIVRRILHSMYAAGVVLPHRRRRFVVYG